MVHSGGFCDNMSRGEKRCCAQHGGGPHLTVAIMLGGRPGLFSTVNWGGGQSILLHWTLSHFIQQSL